MTRPSATDGAIGRLADQGKGPGAIGAMGLAEVDFVAGDRRAAGHMGGGDAGEGLVGQEGGLDVEQAQGPTLPAGPRGLGIVDQCGPASGSRRRGRGPAAAADMGGGRCPSLRGEALRDRRWSIWSRG